MHYLVNIYSVVISIRANIRAQLEIGMSTTRLVASSNEVETFQLRLNTNISLKIGREASVIY